MITGETMKKIFFVPVLALMAAAVSAQTSDAAVNEDELELPEVTTVITGGSMKAGKDSVPDYTKIIPDHQTNKVELPELGASEGKIIPAENTAEAAGGKGIYAEGQLGGGYPFYFLGDFSIYRASGPSPFSINFRHESTEGFADKKAADGYFVRETDITALKSFSGEKSSHSLSAFYRTSDDGLQSESSEYNSQVKHTFGGTFSGKWKFADSFSFFYGTDGNWYNRYSGFETSVTDRDSVLSKTSVLFLEPYIGFGYSRNSFGVTLKADYQTQLNLGERDAFRDFDGSNKESSHRGQFEAGVKWETSLVSLWANVSAVIGTDTGDENVIVPFALGTDWKINAFASERLLLLKAEGGCSSYQETVQNLETKYRYSVLGYIPQETTDWYGRVSASIPLRDVLTVTGGAEFRKTAFENGEWSADYSSMLSALSGLYGILPEERTQFNTSAGIEFSWNDFKFTGDYIVFWKDIPALYDKQNVLATALYQAKDARWSSMGKFRLGLGEGADKPPEFGANIAYKVSSSIRLALEVNDIVKLFKSETRSYAHSDYVQKSGNIAVLAKFQF